MALHINKKRRNLLIINYLLIKTDRNRVSSVKEKGSFDTDK